MPGDHSELEPPLPIPNRSVKRLRADDSADYPCESRSSPGSYPQNPSTACAARGFVFGDSKCGRVYSPAIRTSLWASSKANNRVSVRSPLYLPTCSGGGGWPCESACRSSCRTKRACQPPFTEVALFERKRLDAGSPGLHLEEAKSLLSRLQRAMIAPQVAEAVTRTSVCATCGSPLACKGHHRLVFRTAFGGLSIDSPRLYPCRQSMWRQLPGACHGPCASGHIPFSKKMGREPPA